MINDEQRTSHFYNKLAGTENDLGHVLSTYVDSEHEITNFCRSQYVDISEIHAIFQKCSNTTMNYTISVPESLEATARSYRRQDGADAAARFDKFLPARAS